MPSTRHPLLRLTTTLGFALALLTGCSTESKVTKGLAKADGYFKAGEYEKAEIEYKNVLQLSGRNGTAIGRLGVIYLEQGKFFQGSRYLLAAVDLQPENVDLRLKLGYAYYAAGQPAKARDAALWVLERNPKHETAPYLLADSAAQARSPKEIVSARTKLQGMPATASTIGALGQLDLYEPNANPKEAEAKLLQSRQMNAKVVEPLAVLAVIYIGRKDFELAEKTIASAAQMSPPRALARMQNIQFNLQTGKIDVAKRLLDEMIRATPDYLPGYLTRANVALAEKKADEAIGLFEKVLEREPSHPDALLGTIQTRINKGELDKALPVAQKAATTWPGVSAFHFELGNVYLGTGDLTKAAASFGEALRLSPDYPGATLALARVNLRLRNFGDAIAALKGFLEKNRANSDAYLLLAEAHRSQGNLDDAGQIYSQFVEANPTSAQLRLLAASILAEQNKRDEARQMLNKAIELEPDLLAAIDLLVRLDLSDRQYKVALGRIDVFIAKNLKNAQAYLIRAQVNQAGSDAEKAEADLLKALSLEPGLASAQEMLTAQYLASKQTEKALALLQATVQKDAANDGAWMRLGQLQETTRDFAGARLSYEKVLGINPKAAGALNNLAYIYSVQFREWDKAQEMAQRARDLLPNRGETADTLGWILLQRRQFSRALGLIENAAEKLPENPEVTFHLGVAYYLMGQEDRARIALERSLKLQSDFPGNEDAQRALKVLALDPKTDDASARATLEQTLAARGDDPVALLRLAGIEERAGKLDRALSLSESALKFNSANTNAALTAIRLYRTRKENAKALELTRATRQLAPTDGRVAHVLGQLLVESGDRQAAVGALQDAARRLPGDADVLFDLGDVAYSVGQISVAESSLREALASAAGSSRAPKARQHLDLMALAQDPAKAAAETRIIEQALQADASSVPALMAKAVADETKGDTKAAKLAYERALARYPDFTPAKRSLAIFYAASKEDDKKALELASKAREVYPADPDLAKALGLLLYRQGNFARAVGLLQESARNREADSNLMYYLGMAQRQNKEQAAGNRSLQRALDLGLGGELATEAKKALSPTTK